ncbi:MAG: hypothetical protein WBF71_14255 [Microthrixaceae bacterium]
MDQLSNSPVTVSTHDHSASAADFSESVRLVLAVARRLDLDTPVFRSPPRTAGLDRTIQRRGDSTVIAIRREARPLAAVQADIVEGVVVANYLDPEAANEFRRLSWSAMDSQSALGSISGDSSGRSTGGVAPAATEAQERHAA